MVARKVAQQQLDAGEVPDFREGVKRGERELPTGI